MPKRIPPLTAKKLASVRAGHKTTELADGYIPGLRVRILPSGNRTWSLNINDSNGIRRRFNLGSGLSLAEARRKGESLRRDVRDGADPTQERRVARQRARAARQGIGTLRALVETYFAAGPGRLTRRAAKHKRLVQTVFAKVIDKPALDITRGELQLVADHWQSAASASLAVRLLRPCLKWAEKRELVRAGVAGIEQTAATKKRERVLAPDEIRAIWPHLNSVHGLVLKWLLWTGCRLNEAAGMKWDEITGHNWKIPAARSKNGRQRIVPLPHQAIACLRKCKSGDAQALVFPSARGGVLSNWDRVTKRLYIASGTTGWHRHDLRRTAATLLGDLGFLPHVIKVVLGHAHIVEGATAVYARSRYQRDHRDALQALADEIERIVADRANVIRFAAVS